MAVRITVTCDEPNPRCGASIRVTDVTSFTTLAIVVAQDGWSEHNGKNYCRAHTRQTAQVGASNGQ